MILRKCCMAGVVLVDVMLLIRSKVAGQGAKQQNADKDTSEKTADYYGRVPRMLSTTGTTYTPTTSCERQR